MKESHIRFEVPFDADDFPSIFDRPAKLHPKSKLLSALAIGIALYLGGYIYSAIGGFPQLFLETPVFRHIAFAVFLALTTINYGKYIFIESLIIIRPCFDIPDKDYSAHIFKWMSTIFNRRGLLVTWSFFAFISTWGVISVFYPNPRISNLISFLSLFKFNEILSPEWFFEPRIPKLILVISILLLGAIPLSIGIWGGYKAIPLITELANMPVIPVPSILLVRLRKPTEVFLQVSFVWFLLTASTGLVLFNAADFITISLLLIIGSVGLILFFLPQFAFHALLVRSYYKLTDVALQEYFYLKFHYHEKESAKKMIDYCLTASEQIKPKDLWVFDINDIILLILGQVVSLAGTVWQAFHP
jgi:hypothetical protein